MRTTIPDLLRGSLLGLWLTLLINSGCLEQKQFLPVEDSQHAEELEAFAFTHPALQVALSSIEIAHIAPAAAPEASSLPAPVEALDAARVATLLARLPAGAVVSADQNPSAIRPDSPPPPRPGKIVDLSFAPSESEAPHAAPGELCVLRYAPEGLVSMAAGLLVTFSAPMVPITTHRQIQPPPINLEPEVQGLWRWVGAQTAAFEPQPRFPMATKYHATIPAGTRSLDGSTLAQEVTWSFETPAPELIAHSPGDDPQPADPLIFLAFDQRVLPEEVLACAQMKADGDPRELRLVDQAEIAADSVCGPAILRQQSDVPLDRTVVLRSRSPLPLDREIRFELAAGLPSAEGPLRTTVAQRFDFRTYAPLRIVAHGCGGEPCRPGPLPVVFNNPLAVDARDASDLVTIEPAVEDKRVRCYHNRLEVMGRVSPATNYRVTLSRELRDAFGQSLGEDVELTFQVGLPRPGFQWNVRDFAVMDPALPPTLPMYVVGLPAVFVTCYAVSPADWRQYGGHGRPTDFLAGTVVYQTTLEPRQRTLDAETLLLDLRPAFKRAAGNVLVRASAQMGDRRPYERFVWLQQTDIGLSAHAEGESMLVWVTELATGKPISGAEVMIDGGTRKAITSSDGLAVLAIEGKYAYVTARKRARTAWLPLSKGERREARDRLLWFVADDRGLYRPGETVQVKGWLRRLTHGITGDLAPVGDAAMSVQYAVTARGSRVASGEREVDAFGGFAFAFDLPSEVNLGSAAMELVATGSTMADGHEHRRVFRIEEFRRPEFEVHVDAGEGAVLQNSCTSADVTALYYTGAGMPVAPLTWRVTAGTGHYRPPDRGEFDFGPEAGFAANQDWSIDATTSESGRHRLAVDIGRGPAIPMLLRAEATVQDLNRQTQSKSVQWIVHPGDLYVGIRRDARFVEWGESLHVATIVTDIDGRVVAGRRIDITVEHLVDPWASGRSRRIDRRHSFVLTSTDSIAWRSFRPDLSGRWVLRAIVRDDAERESMTEVARWVSGGQSRPNRRILRESVQLIPDRESWAPGDTARVLAILPWAPAEVLVTLQRHGLLRTERLSLDSNSVTLTAPMTEADVPGLLLTVEAVGAAEREGHASKHQEPLPLRPASATGSIHLGVSPQSRRLEVVVAPAAETVSPGASTHVVVHVRDHTGAPVRGAQVLLIAVDEAVLSMTGHRLGDPMEVFYRHLSGGVRSERLRDRLLAPPNEEVLAQMLPPPTKGLHVRGGRSDEVEHVLSADDQVTAYVSFAAALPPGGMPGASDAGSLALRSDFDPLACFAAALVTDGDGAAIARFELPDNLTCYRLMAAAADTARCFGRGDGTLTARLPLMVRPSLPRFLNLGDVCELPIQIENRTEEELAVEIAVRAANLEILGPAGKRLVISAGDRIETRFPARTVRPGTATVDIVAESGRWSDAAAVTLPVRAPATVEAFATYGTLDEGVVHHRIAIPTDVFSDYGNLEVTTSSTALQALTDAVLYLTDYPFQCTEQLASRVLAIAALHDVLQVFEAEGFDSVAALAAARDAVRDLLDRQQPSGGFGLWSRDGTDWTFASVHAAHALAMARARSFSANDEAERRARTYLKNIKSHLPNHCSASSRQSLIAYALYVLHLMNDDDPSSARRLVDDAGGIAELPREALGWLLPVLDTRRDEPIVTEIHRLLINSVVETASTAQFTTAYADDGHIVFHGARRTDAVLLLGLMTADPDNDLIPKLVRGLLAHRTRGHWSTTQENAWVLLALNDYFRRYEGETPDFVARTWFGRSLLSEVDCGGRSTDQHRLSVPMRILTDEMGDDLLVLGKEGRGRLYYRIALRYAPRDLDPQPVDHGFEVSRTFEAVDDSSDVWRDVDGTYHVRAGARVRSRLTMVVPARRYHVALTDPIPAGLEILNPRLVGTEKAPGGTGRDGPHLGYRGRWFEHQNLRDDRTEAFSSQLWGGVYTYTYIGRATTPGRYRAAPPRAEEMYAPETFGRGEVDIVVVE